MKRLIVTPHWCHHARVRPDEEASCHYELYARPQDTNTVDHYGGAGSRQLPATPFALVGHWPLQAYGL